MSLAKVQEEIIGLMALIAQKKTEEAEVKIEQVIEVIHEGLDLCTNDEELVHWGKFLKIVEALQDKLKDNE
ncbi:MAG: hypothetical protein LBE34_06360 [Flavobacteriaceae bacterium]|jgi:flagellin-specific chaperone FliS|nr:hypothetical protein [Flavobacteriaceae bacterium]